MCVCVLKFLFLLFQWSNTCLIPYSSYVKIAGVVTVVQTGPWMKQLPFQAVTKDKHCEMCAWNLTGLLVGCPHWSPNTHSPWHCFFGLVSLKRWLGAGDTGEENAVLLGEGPGGSSGDPSGTACYCLHRREHPAMSSFCNTVSEIPAPKPKARH